MLLFHSSRCQKQLNCHWYMISTILMNILFCNAAAPIPILPDLYGGLLKLIAFFYSQTACKTRVSHLILYNLNMWTWNGNCHKNLKFQYIRVHLYWRLPIFLTLRGYTAPKRACTFVSHNPLFWKSQTTQSIIAYLWPWLSVILEVPVKNCMVRYSLTCPMLTKYSMYENAWKSQILLFIVF